MSRKKLTIDKLFSDRLRILIKEKLDISQVEFCNKIGITEGYLSMMLSGKRGASAEVIAGLFLNYREYLEWLLTGRKKTIPEVTDEDFEINELLLSAKRILKSGNKLAADSLATNIRFLEQSVEPESSVKKMAM